MLDERGEEVVILARATSDLGHLSSTQVRVIRSDLANPAALKEAVRDVAYIFHCAACSTDWAPKQTYIEANVIGTQNLLAAAQQTPGLHRLWVRETTLTESICTTPSRSSSRNSCARPTSPSGRGPARPWAARATRRASLADGPVNTLPEALADPNALARGAVLTGEDGRLWLGPAIRFADEPARPLWREPELGAS